MPIETVRTLLQDGAAHGPAGRSTRNHRRVPLGEETGIDVRGELASVRIYAMQLGPAALGCP